MFCHRFILDTTFEHEVHKHQLYVDYKRVYDIRNMAKLVEIMNEFGITINLLLFVKMTLADTNNNIGKQGKISHNFHTKNGR